MTRRDLMLAGRRLFSDKGLYESRVEEITATADIGKGTLYRYFRNKEELVRAVVADGFDDLGRRLSRRTTAARSHGEVVAAIVAAHLDYFSENPDMLRIFHQMRGLLKFDQPQWRPLRRVLQSHLDFLAREIGRFPAAGVRRRSAHRDLAVLLFGGVSGVLSVRVAAAPGPVPPQIAAALLPAFTAMAGGYARGTRNGHFRRRRSGLRQRGRERA